MPTQLDRGTRKARKDRRCSCCKKIIPKGEAYFFASLVDDEGPPLLCVI